mgnify:CR=1 FL=1
MSVGANLLRFNLENKKFIVYDCESESLNLTCRAWELGFIIYHGTKEVEKHVLYLDWPGLKVSPEAAKITGFNYQTIRDKGIDPKKAIDLFDSYIYNPDYYVVFQNGMGFDCMIHNSMRKMLGYKPDYSYLKRCYDTKCLSMAYKLGKKFNPETDDFLAWQISLGEIRKKGVKTSLGVMYKELFGEELIGAHAASVDISATMRVFIELTKKIEIY